MAPGVAALLVALGAIVAVIALEIGAIAFAKITRERIERYERDFGRQLVERLIDVVDGDQPFYAAGGRSVSVGAERFEIAPPRGIQGRATREVMLSLINTISGVGQRRLTEILEQSGYVRAAMRKADARNATTRARACSILGAMMSKQAIPLLTDRFLNDEDAGVRLTAAEALARIGDPPSADVLMRALHNRTRWHHLRIANVLSQMGVAAVLPLQRALLSDDEPAVSLALDILSDIGLLDGSDELNVVLKHPNPEIRARAVELLGIVGDVDAIDRVVAAADDETSFVRVRAARALARLGIPDDATIADRYYATLDCLLDDENWWVRQHAGAALAAAGERGIAILRASASDAAASSLQMQAMKEEAV
ncbi:MAG TPA: HEAT repeat domain-containing protein [Candidatus Baltobacteraceae bacterium]|nr:HEAT repeat domain-containing protein [Candidatus Baltobacteraceae bacterium]